MNCYDFLNNLQIINQLFNLINFDFQVYKYGTSK